MVIFLTSETIQLIAHTYRLHKPLTVAGGIDLITDYEDERTHFVFGRGVVADFYTGSAGTLISV